MQFTPQQLAGAGRFNSKTRIGNWNEDTVLDEIRMTDYRARKARGTLSSNRQQKKFLLSQAPVCLTSSCHDNVLRFGDYLQLRHEQSHATLACDLWEETETGSGDYLVSMSITSAQPVARNTFKIVRVSTSLSDDKNDNIVHYGDAFRLMCHERLCVRESITTNQLLKPMMYLKSDLKNERRASPVSGNQLVSATNRPDAATIWTATCVRDDAESYLATGTSVTCDSRLAIVHHMTGAGLFGHSSVAVGTDFGLDELEVACFSTRRPGKCHHLENELVGRRTAATCRRVVEPENVWRVILGPRSREDPDREAEQDNLETHVPTFERITQILQRQVSDQGQAVTAAALVSLAHTSSGRDLDREDVKWALKDLGLSRGLMDEHLDLFLDVLDDGRTGRLPLARVQHALLG